ncbi:MAG: acyl-CoA dehydrogenase family protein, partial [Spongiibacteraceae bacterium]|nr:acyl-CoA dehydrogenase family protein [Spongiibacteraceae bacterium]
MPGVPLPPRRHLPTHEVTNQPPPLIDCNLYTTHPALTEAIDIGPGWATELLVPFGDRLASEEIATAARQANEAPPRLHSFDRFGQRIDEIEFHPAYHQLMQLGLEQGLHALPWLERPGGHTVHAALEYLLVQVEAGVCCPMTMTYAAVPALRQAPALAAEWEPKLLATAYDPRPLPLHAKRAVTCGMAMTEKQGGSDVRANQTSAVRSSEGFWLLTGHKWFCSAPMSDLFLTLAQTPAGLSCFAVPRWLPDGSRNPVYLLRLLAKLGNHAIASAEREFLDTAGWLVGEEG